MKRAVERVLEDGELPGVAAFSLVQETFNQPPAHARPDEAQRLFNRIAQLLSGQLRDQVEAAIHCFGKAGELRAVFHVIGPHRQHDVHGRAERLRGFEQRGDKQPGLGVAVLFTTLPRIAEQLFVNWLTTTSRFSPS